MSLSNWNGTIVGPAGVYFHLFHLFKIRYKIQQTDKF